MDFIQLPIVTSSLYAGMIIDIVRNLSIFPFLFKKVSIKERKPKLARRKIRIKSIPKNRRVATENSNSGTIEKLNPGTLRNSEITIARMHQCYIYKSGVLSFFKLYYSLFQFLILNEWFFLYQGCFISKIRVKIRRNIYFINMDHKT